MLLVVDVGNTTTVIGVFSDDGSIRQKWRITTKNRTADELGVYLLSLLDMCGISSKDIDGAIMSSVVPPLDVSWEKAVKFYLGIDLVQVNPFMDIGVKLKYLSPHEIGADRLVNAVAALHEYGSPVVIVDFGTAITIDVVDSEGVYLGGAIAPGIAISMEALYGKTAKLPKVSFQPPPDIIGRTTEESIRVGIIYGFAGLVDSLVKGVKQKLKENLQVIATGGHASIIAPISETIQKVDEDLTLKGLKIIYDRCKNK